MKYGQLILDELQEKGFYDDVGRFDVTDQVSNLLGYGNLPCFFVRFYPLMLFIFMMLTYLHYVIIGACYLYFEYFFDMCESYLACLCNIKITNLYNHHLTPSELDHLKYLVIKEAFRSGNISCILLMVDFGFFML